MENKYTLVTGLWDIKRDSLSEGWNRSFEDHYLAQFRNLLELDCNIIIYGDKELQQFVVDNRINKPYMFIHRDIEWFKQEFYDQIQSIRTDPKWYNQAPWLKDSTQAKLEMYNPLVMSKMFLLNDATHYGDFENYYWIDAGLTHTVNIDLLKHVKKLPKKINRFTFVCFPYNANNEIHGFSYPEINKYANNEDINLVARGGFFGGPKHSINEANGHYHGLLTDTLSDGYMGTEESVFSIMLFSKPQSYDFFKIEEDGLLYKFFENLQQDKAFKEKISGYNLVEEQKVGLYVIGFNSPKQFDTLVKSIKKYDKQMFIDTEKYLLNNSIDRSTDKEYTDLCEKYDFTQIKKDNIGICGGRQFIAEHFNKTNLDYYYFFEDDMFFYNGAKKTCTLGFPRRIESIHNRVLTIAQVEKLDFLKLNFTEFFGDNSKQWAWNNLPEDKKKLFFPHSKNQPYTSFKNIKSLGVPYALGDVYYCNWPQLVSRVGNTKMFLDLKWEYPYEQTWMSHFYHLTREGKLKGAVLLATPTLHDRFDHYDKEIRREN